MTDFKILVADDDAKFLLALTNHLQNEGFSTIIAKDGCEALLKYNTLEPDFLILDIVMPNKDGLQVCREVRSSSNIPIILMSVKSELFDIVLGLELGADDYLVKPFDFKELVARIKAILRRSKNVKAGESAKVVMYDKLILNITNYQLLLNGKQVFLPAKELELLYFLAASPNKVFSRDRLLDEVWGFDYYGDSRTVDVHIKRLRDVLKNVSPKWRLKTVWGVGYKFEVDKKNQE